MYKPKRTKSSWGFLDAREMVAEIVAGKKFWSSTKDTDKKGPFYQ